MEEWRDIIGWPYRVSNFGRVRGPRGLLRPTVNGSGRLQVSLCAAPRRRVEEVHRIVARAFLGAPPSAEHEVAHWDGDPTNNAVANLRWATAKENASDRERHGRTARGEGSGTARLTEELVREIRRSGLGMRPAARAFGIPMATAWRVIHNVTWRHVR
jgi:hypothetical protein